MCGDNGECLLLIRRYFHRTADDSEGLTFKQWQPEKKGEVLAVNSSELRALQGHQKNDFSLTLINAPELRERIARCKKAPSKAGVEYSPRQRWRLDLGIDQDTRKVCECH